MLIAYVYYHCTNVLEYIGDTKRTIITQASTPVHWTLIDK